MKKNYALIITIVALTINSLRVNAQCATTATLGTATNMFTLIRNGNHPIVVDKTMNMVAFIHRTDAALLGGNSGELRYDYSINSGATWTINQGVLNPLNSNYARYPNIAIHNPSNNITPSNAYVSYLAPTITSATAAWNGVVAGASQLGTAITTESYNPNGLGTTQIPHSMVKGAPGIYWAIDPINTIATGFNIYRGVWNSTINDISWSVNYSVNPPFSSGWTSAPQVVDYNIAFDPSGQIGYFSFLGHMSTGPTATAIYPILYKTINGGTTWTGPITIDVSGMSCITSNVISGSVPSCNVEHDLIVDANGNPHVITTVGSSAGTVFNYGAWHHMFDFTLRNGLWVGHDLGNVNGGLYTFGVSPNFATMWQAPQAARSADGTKLFFTWTDNSSYSLGAGNSLPDLYGKAYNVTTNSWTPTKNFTSCNPAINGRILFPHIAAEVLEPTATSWKMAGVYGTPSVTNDLGAVANFYYLDNLTFSSTEFTVPVPTATVTIAQGPNLLYCPNTTVNINVPNAGQVIWSTGATTNPLPVTSSSISTFTVLAQVGCQTGTASISVTNLTVNAGAVSPSVCPAAAANFTAAGNALTYSWSPGTTTGTNVTFVPTSGTVTLTATGSSGCAIINTVAINILSNPTISIAGSQTTCVGYTASLTAGGAQSFVWSTGSSSASYSFVASTNTVLSVIGTAANTCTGTAATTVVVNPTPILSSAQGATAVCLGQSVTFLGNGSAQTFSWNGNPTGPNLIVTPQATSVYTLSGSNSYSCIGTTTAAIVVNPLPTLSVSATRTALCRSEKQLLTASGATSYTWLPLGVISPTLLYSSSTAGSFSLQVQMTSAESCTNTGTFLMNVSTCAGINEANIVSQIMVWPNPSKGEFNVKAESDQSISVFSSIGQLVSSIELKAGETAQIQNLAAGIYYVRVGNDATKAIRVVITE